MTTPHWDARNKTAAILKWTDHLHRQARDAFRADKTHLQIVFMFGDAGLVSINPVPEGQDHAGTQAAIRRAVKDHHLYAVIHIGEVWTYFTHAHDHTAAQLRAGEIKVSELRPQDRTECLYVRMESRDGASVVLLDRIVREKGAVTLGAGRRLDGETRQWF